MRPVSGAAPWFGVLAVFRVRLLATKDSAAWQLALGPPLRRDGHAHLHVEPAVLQRLELRYDVLDLLPLGRRVTGEQEVQTHPALPALQRYPPQVRRYPADHRLDEVQ